VDFARDTDVIDGRHVHEKTSGQSDVTGDARALFAERLLGDLDDYILTSLEHFGNELRAARRAGVMAMASLMPAIMTRTAWSAGTALEALPRASAAAAFRTAATIVGASSAALGTATAIIAAAVTSTAAEGALETLARIAADACGVARKLFARRGRAACSARRAGFSRQQDDVVLGDRGCRGSGNEMVYRDVFGVGALRFFLAVGFFVMFGVMLGVMFCVGGMCFAVK